MLSADVWRESLALFMVASYVGLSLLQYRRFHQPAAIRDMPLPVPEPALANGALLPVWVVYASQTGQAEALARQTSEALTAAGLAVRLVRFDMPWLSEVGHVRCVLFVVSTHGEGGPPDHARYFMRQHMQAAEPRMRGMQYAVLALGDRNYAQFCGFGRTLDDWLRISGALPLFPRIDIDRLDAQGMSAWMHALGVLGVASEGFVVQAQTFTAWRLVARRLLNAGSHGAPLCLLCLQPTQGLLPDWRAGDLADVCLKEDPAHPRTYSIASVPEDGVLELVVRTRIDADGRKGRASVWLNERAGPDDPIMLRVRANPAFRLEAGTDTPLILIGAGAGLAGLRAHLHARSHALRAAQVRPAARCVWLIFGERSVQHDQVCRAEFATLLEQGVLTHADFVFSRDATLQPYVQDALCAYAGRLREWLDAGACILVCGAAATMGQGVDRTLRHLLGDAQVEVMIAAQRIRRDVF